MNNKCFVSIIVPVYKIEDYIEQCVCCVLKQTFTEYELILVNDGSPDKCPELCDHFAESDNRVKTIHKTNGGLSDARNEGLKHASGEYVLFLDGDDYWDDEDALSRLYARALLSKADIINFSYKKVYPETGEEIQYFTTPSMSIGLTFDEQLEYLVDNNLYIASACNKMIRRTLLDDLCFENEVSSEDIVWCLELIAKASSVDYVLENFYCYRQRPHSITHMVNNKRCGDLAKVVLNCIVLADSANDTFRDLFYVYSAFQYGTFILVQAQAEQYQREWIGCLARHKDILKYHGSNKKLLCLRLGCTVLGYVRLCRLVRTIYRLIKR